MKLSIAAISALALLINFCLLATAQASGNYHVEVVVFENSLGTNGNSFSASQSKALPSKGKTWRYSTAYLNGHAKKLSNSPSYRVLKHTAWGQRSAGYSDSAAQHLTGNAIDGWVKVYAKSLLFVQLDVSYKGRQIKERRRLKLNEVHYFDNAGFGMLMRVSRAK